MLLNVNYESWPDITSFSQPSVRCASSSFTSGIRRSEQPVSYGPWLTGMGNKPWYRSAAGSQRRTALSLERALGGVWNYGLPPMRVVSRVAVRCAKNWLHTVIGSELHGRLDRVTTSTNRHRHFPRKNWTLPSQGTSDQQKLRQAPLSFSRTILGRGRMTDFRGAGPPFLISGATPGYRHNALPSVCAMPAYRAFTCGRSNFMQTLF